MKKRVQHLLSAFVLTSFLFMAFGSDDDKKETEKTSNLSESGTSSENTPDIEILKHDATFEESMDSYTIHCRVKNNTDKLINYVDIKATFYDKDGNIVGTGLGNAANFAGGAEKTIDVIGLDIQNCEKYEVQVNNSF
ncbi:MAG TPA: FxLYD domain-containing protein [Flavobacterium sp.]|uniref:FxLYD domain-containing protein n=2 Tax=Flavobacterium sp. TaxID=239 RepID=UPI002B4B61DF|nr:FxLYD domain-containing protein [Flavobacterium sp.]HLO73041.1 FxLYD domain-containing protein [Flavobacterium sp.]